jgi:3-oxoacyl-ACP reductase-like protein
MTCNALKFGNAQPMAYYAESAPAAPLATSSPVAAPAAPQNHPLAAQQQQVMLAALTNEMRLQQIIANRLEQLAARTDVGPREFVDMSKAIGLHFNKIG